MMIPSSNVGNTEDRGVGDSLLVALKDDADKVVLIGGDGRLDTVEVAHVLVDDCAISVNGTLSSSSGMQLLVESEFREIISKHSDISNHTHKYYYQQISQIGKMYNFDQ